MPSTPISIPLGGMYPIGDAAAMPRGKSRMARNVLVRPGNEIVGRPGIQQDAIVTSGAGRFAPYGSTLIYVDSDGKMFEGPSWGAGTTIATMLDGVKHLDDFVFLDGTGQVRSKDRDDNYYLPWPKSHLKAQVITSFLNRVFLGNITLTITNLLSNYNAYYDPTPTNSWTLTNTSMSSVSTTDETLRSISPTATTGSAGLFWDDSRVGTGQGWEASRYVLGESPKPALRIDLRNGTNDDTPMTIQLAHSHRWIPSDAINFRVGDIIVPSTPNGYAYLCLVQDTATDSVEPTWPTDNGATVTEASTAYQWECIGPDVIAEQEVDLLPRKDVPGDDGWVHYTIKGEISIMGDGIASRSIVGVRLLWGNSTNATWSTDLSVDVAYINDATDRTPRNRGIQMVSHHMDVPFYNAGLFGSSTQTVSYPNRIVWTETDSNEIRAVNYWDLGDDKNGITAMSTIEQRLLVWTDDEMWTFNGTADPDLPLQRAGQYSGVGCLGPHVIDASGGLIYFADDTSVYSTQGGRPEPVIDDGMRRHIFPLPASHTQCMAIDQVNNELWFGRNDRAYVKNLDTGEWSVMTVRDSVGAAETFRDMIWFDKKMHFSFDGHLRTMDESFTIDTEGGQNVNVLHVYALPNIDTVSPRKDFRLNEVEIRHRITSAGNSITIYQSKDRWKASKTGEKYKVLSIVELAENEEFTQGGADALSWEPSTEHVKTAFWQRNEDIFLTLQHDGYTGPANFRISGVILHVEDLGEHIQTPRPTVTGSSL